MSGYILLLEIPGSRHRNGVADGQDGEHIKVRGTAGTAVI